MRVTAAQARRLLLDAQGLFADPARRATAATVMKVVSQLGFVQLDSIQRIERAHHLILGARLDGYQQQSLHHLAFEKRALFEHWTHDASLIPTGLYGLWKPRFARGEKRLRASKWFTHRLGAGASATRAINKVLSRVTRQGPTRARDFDRGDHGRATGWWDWTPEKTALEFLWQTGTLAITARDGFEKLYDLAERVFPDLHAAPHPDPDAHLDWAGRSALERLGVATSNELAGFWGAISLSEAAHWAKAATQRGELVIVDSEAVDGSSRPAFAFADWKDRLARIADAPERLRVLAPFDPLIRDRKRLLRLFGFDYRFEAFVPAPQRKWGYYVLPILEGERLIGRVDPRFDRAKGSVVIEGLWWEPGIKPTRTRLQRLNEALDRIRARQVGDASSA
jgi:uncharacterized protein YcaQ